MPHNEITPAILRGLAHRLELQDNVRGYMKHYHDQQGPSWKPNELNITIYDGKALTGNKELCDVLETVVLEAWPYLMSKVDEALEKEVKQCAENLGIIIRDPLAK